MENWDPPGQREASAAVTDRNHSAAAKHIRAKNKPTRRLITLTLWSAVKPIITFTLHSRHEEGQELFTCFKESYIRSSQRLHRRRTISTGGRWKSSLVHGCLDVWCHFFSLLLRILVDLMFNFWFHHVFVDVSFLFCSSRLLIRLGLISAF